jgi:hypothetical protein
MDKFIFVCYKNGCGGEQLALKISNTQGCIPLEFNKHGKRTVVKDIFKSNLLKKIPASNFVPNPGPDTDFNVVPTHMSPDVLQETYPNSIFVVIKLPESDIDKKKLILRKYRYFELSASPGFIERLGEYRDLGGNMTDKEKIKHLVQPLKNIEIRCLVNDLESNSVNFKKLFLDKISRKKTFLTFPYTLKENLIVIDFIDVYNNKIDKLFKEISIRIGGDDK